MIDAFSHTVMDGYCSILLLNLLIYEIYVSLSFKKITNSVKLN